MNTASDIGRYDQSSTASERAIALGRYRLIARLGTGGMAEVYLAVAQGAMNVNRLVVVKRLREEQSEDEAAREMFLDEARLAARLAHPNVVQTFEAGIEEGKYFFAMEYIEGQPLSRVLSAMKRAARTMAPKVAARIAADALGGLHYAHELTDFDGSPLAIVHRDVSPQNIMLTYDGAVKIVDFGIAKAAGTAETAHGVFKGKVAFMAPEQVLGQDVDRRADVFAAGIVLWEAVTGTHLMADESPAKTLHNLMTKRIARASEIRPDVPPALDAILAKALERDAACRYASAKEMRDALEAFIADAGGASSDEVGEVVRANFAETRAKVQEQVKAQLAALSFRADAMRAGRSDVSRTHIRTVPGLLIDLSDGALGGTTSGSARGSRLIAHSELAQVPASRTKRVAYAAWIAMTMATAGVSGLALYRAQRLAGSGAPPAEAANPRPTATQGATTSSAPAPASVPAATTTERPTQGEASTSSATSSSTAAPTSATSLAVRAWRPPIPGRPTPPATSTPVATSSAPSVDVPRVQPAPSPPPAKPAEVPTGRTFRREL